MFESLVIAYPCVLPVSPPDLFLIGTVMFVFGTGLYELFISNMDMSYGSNLFGLFNLPVRSHAHPCQRSSGSKASQSISVC